MVAGLFNPIGSKSWLWLKSSWLKNIGLKNSGLKILGFKCPATNLIIQVFWCWIMASIETFSFGQFCDFTERGFATQNFRRWRKLKCWSKTAHLSSKVIIEWFSPESAKYLFLPSENLLIWLKHVQICLPKLEMNRTFLTEFVIRGKKSSLWWSKEYLERFQNKNL